jgi:hypothetical protein
MESVLNINLDTLTNNKNKFDKIDNIKFKKMLLLYNAAEDGWTIKKKSGSYIFIKNHNGKKEILHENYLLQFMKQNFQIDTILL